MAFSGLKVKGVKISQNLGKYSSPWLIKYSDEEEEEVEELSPSYRACE